MRGRLGGAVEPDLDWTFEQYRAYEQGRAAQSDDEQREATSLGLVADPKSAPHGGYRVACTWSDEVIVQAGELSAQLAAIFPGTPAYPQNAIHSSIGNLRPATDRVIDPDGVAEDRVVLDQLCEAAEEALRGVAESLDASTAVFGPAYLARRMAYVFGRVGEGYWRLQQAVHEASAKRGIELVNSWGPHLTLTRFGAAAGPEMARRAGELLGSWRTVVSPPQALIVGYYTVGDGHFEVTTYRSLPIP
jgi:hypothetical protein